MAMRIQAAGLALDLLLTGGRVLDGAGNPWFVADVGIRGDRIAFVGNAAVEGVTAELTLDVGGRLVAPGFIDMHSHARFDDDRTRAALNLLAQGITTGVAGVDGDGEAIARTLGAWEKGGMGINMAMLVGHNAARRSVMGLAARAPTPGELEQMRLFVRTGLEEGALGLSTGLFYVPGSFSRLEEVVELARVAGEYGVYYDSHVRDEGVAHSAYGWLNSIRELVEIGERARLPVHVAHIHPLGPDNFGLAQEAVSLIEQARARGVEVTADNHPYLASSTTLLAVVPPWAQAGGVEALRRRLADPELSERLQVEVEELIRRRGGPASLVLTSSGGGLDLEGKSLADLAAKWSCRPYEAVSRILSRTLPEVVSHNQVLEDVETLTRQDWMMTCTDGDNPVFGEGRPHPRSYGAFPQKLRVFVRERGTISLPFAVRGMTSLAARRLGLRQRGLVQEGYYADLVVFDPDRFTDRATYLEPHRHAEGVAHLVVNGKLAIRDGQPTGALAGVALRRGAAPSAAPAGARAASTLPPSARCSTFRLDSDGS